MSQHVAISPTEAADRLAIRELIEAYAHCADRRDAKGQMALFTADTHFLVSRGGSCQGLAGQSRTGAGDSERTDAFRLAAAKRGETETFRRRGASKAILRVG